jgi:hypothetical protein
VLRAACRRGRDRLGARTCTLDPLTRSRGRRTWSRCVKGWGFVYFRFGSELVFGFGFSLSLVSSGFGIGFGFEFGV